MPNERGSVGSLGNARLIEELFGIYPGAQEQYYGAPAPVTDQGSSNMPRIVQVPDETYYGAPAPISGGGSPAIAGEATFSPDDLVTLWKMLKQRMTTQQGYEQPIYRNKGSYW